MSVIDEYLDQVPALQRAELERVRQIVHNTVPDAEETISYGMPAFKYQGQPLLYFAAFKNHLSLFPTSAPTEILKEKLGDYEVTKGTIRFTPENPLSELLIKEILETRLAIITKV